MNKRKNKLERETKIVLRNKIIASIFVLGSLAAGSASLMHGVSSYKHFERGYYQENNKLLEYNPEYHAGIADGIISLSMIPLTFINYNLRKRFLK
jgi:hypothetical protein